MEYKKSVYQFSQAIHPKIYLCTSFISGYHILLSKEVYALYNLSKLSLLRERFPKVFQRLLEGEFVINKSIDELNLIQEKRKKEIADTSLYHIIINPTLDCNLSCWYCYENRVPNSTMTNEIVEAIKKHIVLHYERVPYKTLKLSFFGGEPFLGFNTIKKIVSFASDYCEEKVFELLLDFTTNGTLCTKSTLEFLSSYKCLFQITLDGDKEQHNKIKHTHCKSIDTFSLTIKNIRDIQRYIKDSRVAIRINYDKDTLLSFNSILNELLTLDRKRTKVILKKIWQVDSKDISREQLDGVMQLLFENKFVVDYYSQGGICFADRKNQAVFNYDGYVFKCTTIDRFDEDNSLGVLEQTTGNILWKTEKMQYLEDFTPQECKECVMYPTCGGPCQKRFSEDSNWSCFLKNTHFNLSEYVLTQFKTHLIKHQIYDDEE